MSVMEDNFRQVWMDDAACKGKSDIFFPERAYHPRHIVKQAKEICANCPVFDQCERWSLTLSGNVPGVYAGMSNRQRRSKRLKLGLTTAKGRSLGYEYGSSRDSH